MSNIINYTMNDVITEGRLTAEYKIFFNGSGGGQQISIQDGIYWLAIGCPKTGDETAVNDVNNVNHGVTISLSADGSVSGSYENSPETNDGFLRAIQFDANIATLEPILTTFTVAGLDDTKLYTFRLSGSRTGSSDGQTKVTIAGVDKSYFARSAAGQNIYDGVEFKELQSSSGVITFDMVGIEDYTYLGGLDIFEYDPIDKIRKLVNQGIGRSANDGIFNSGQALEFNGTSQHVFISDMSLIENCTFSVMINGEGVVITQQDLSTCFLIIDSTQTRFKLNDQNNNFTARVDNVLSVLTFAFSADEITLYINGKFSETRTRLGQIPTILSHLASMIPQQSWYFNGLISNMFLCTVKVSAAEALYLYNHQEAIANIALGGTDENLSFTSAEVANCYALCETDEHIRDIANYSEGDVNIDITNVLTDIDGENNTMSYDNPSATATIYQEVATSTAAIPLLRYVNSNQISTEVYKVNITITVISGTLYLSSIQGNNANGDYVNRTFDNTLSVGTYTFSDIIGFTDEGYLNLLIDGTVQTTYEATVKMTVQKISAIYPIEAFETTMVTSTSQQASGLQSTLLKQDELGRITGVASKNTNEVNSINFTDTGLELPTDQVWSIEEVLYYSGAYHHHVYSYDGIDTVTPFIDTVEQVSVSHTPTSPFKYNEESYL